MTDYEDLVDLRVEVDALEAENAGLHEAVETQEVVISDLLAENKTLKARFAEAERELCTEQAEHTREVLLHAVTKHKLDEAGKLNSQCPALLEAANARADAEKERADNQTKRADSYARTAQACLRDAGPALVEARERAESAKERADRAERAYEGAALQLCKDWQEHKDYLFDTEQRAEKAEAEAGRLKQMVIELGGKP